MSVLGFYLLYLGILPLTAAIVVQMYIRGTFTKSKIEDEKIDDTDIS